MLKYNKRFKTIINISILTYKYYCSNYILNEDKDIEKEYSIKNKLIYEGEYLKWKRNGKGKEYDNFGNIIFEGEYLNWKRWNGKENLENKIIYELKEGKGYLNEYNNLNQLEFEGEYLNGEKNGKWKEYNKETLIFEGEYINWKNGMEFLNHIP